MKEKRDWGTENSCGLGSCLAEAWAVLGEGGGDTALCLRRLVETRRYQECRADFLYASFRKVPDLLWELVTLSEYTRAQFRA